MSRSIDQEAMDTFMVNEQLYHHLFHQSQRPIMHPHQQSMMMDQKEFVARSPSSIMVTPTDGIPLPPNNTPPTPASDNWDDQLRCGGLSGDFEYGIGTPSPTRSQFLFDDHDYQKLRQPPRSTPMIRKNFVQHSPMRPSKRTATQRKSSTYTRWTAEEDELLRQAVALHGPHKWSLIASHVPNRTPMQCSTRWLGALNPNIHKGRWTEHEDAVLKYSFLEFSGIPDGEGGFQPIPWNRIAERIPNRTGIQCQARWTEALDPTVRKGKWSEDEDVLLRAGVEKFGRCWIRIAETVPGRTQRQCRTRWMQIKYKEEKLQKKSPKQPPTQTTNDDAGSSGASCTSTEEDFMVEQVPKLQHNDMFQPQWDCPRQDFYFQPSNLDLLTSDDALLSFFF